MEDSHLSKDLWGLILGFLRWDMEEMARCSCVCSSWNAIVEPWRSAGFALSGTYWFGRSFIDVLHREPGQQRRALRDVMEAQLPFKVLLLGSRGAGKSAFQIRVCATGTFYPNLPSDMEDSFRKQFATVSGCDALAEIDEISHDIETEMHRLLVKNAHALVLLVSVRDLESSTRHAAKLLDQVGASDRVVMICLSQIDAKPAGMTCFPPEVVSLARAYRTGLATCSAKGGGLFSLFINLTLGLLPLNKDDTNCGDRHLLSGPHREYLRRLLDAPVSEEEKKKKSCIVA